MAVHKTKIDVSKLIFLPMLKFIGAPEVCRNRRLEKCRLFSRQAPSSPNCDGLPALRSSQRSFAFRIFECSAEPQLKQVENIGSRPESLLSPCRRRQSPSLIQARSSAANPMTNNSRFGNRRLKVTSPECRFLQHSERSQQEWRKQPESDLKKVHSRTVRDPVSVAPRSWAPAEVSTCCRRIGPADVSLPSAGTSCLEMVRS